MNFRPKAVKSKMLLWSKNPYYLDCCRKTDNLARATQRKTCIISERFFSRLSLERFSSLGLAFGSFTYELYYRYQYSAVGVINRRAFIMGPEA
jgi:hypothetical protein